MNEGGGSGGVEMREHKEFQAKKTAKNPSGTKF